MKYAYTIELALPRERVFELFDDVDNLYKWQEGLQSFKHLEGEFGKVGMVSELVYLMGKRKVVMIETIKTMTKPSEFSATYEAKGVWNLVENTFEETDKGCKWTITTEFKCKGMVAVMAFLMPSMFKKATLKSMNRFKAFAEAEK